MFCAMSPMMGYRLFRCLHGRGESTFRGFLRGCLEDNGSLDRLYNLNKVIIHRVSGQFGGNKEVVLRCL